MTVGISTIPALSRTMQGEEMLQPEEVAAMLRLHELGWGAKRLAKEFGCARNTVRRYLREDIGRRSRSSTTPPECGRSKARGSLSRGRNDWPRRVPMAVESMKRGSG
jgi:hypothetical protein